MSYDPYTPQARPVADTQALGFDAGLQSFMRSVFNLMGMGLAITGLTAYATANFPPLYNLLFGTGLAFVVMFAPLVFVMVGFRRANLARKSASQLRTTFYIFSAVMGLSMAVLLQIFTGASIARAFFATAAMFGGMSLYGYTTRKDLTGIGAFLMMGLIGVVIASIVNVFLGSAMIGFVVSVICVVVFTGLTAFEVQQLKSTYLYGRQSGEALEKTGIMGALGLYLSFINLFQSMLHLMGNRE